ncbi:hypothetical protein AWENTII_005401 [Aspergillus wentii]|nr:hypothetical protein MW887_000666 [Aspergillus wentii]
MVGPPSKKGSTPSKVPFSVKQASIKKNRSILNFFQKTDSPPNSTSRQPRITQFGTKGGAKNATPTLRREDSSNASSTTGSLFLEDRNGAKSKIGGNSSGGEKIGRERSKTPDDIWGEDEGLDDDRYHENGSANKKRKVDSPSVSNATEDGSKPSHTPVPAKSRHTSGPFIDESDSEDDLGVFGEVDELSKAPGKGDKPGKEPTGVDDEKSDKEEASAVDIPPLVREATSHIEDDEFANFDDLGEEEFRDEELLEPLGEEEEREQPCGFDLYDSNDLVEEGEFEEGSGEVADCPICQTSLAGLNESDVSIHVNNCLDGKPNPAPSKEPPVPPDKALTRQEKAAIARPAQRDPYAAGNTGSTSAFSKLMAGNAEDTAWSTAASNEVSSRGKQAYQRTCPFYKIIPGFSICVDAFRYGAVEGCNAYFLSHFHSDHYVGLTSSWCHGPIYCSKVTGNLVRQQLKVNPKWVVDLEFEKKTEVPGTGGVQVTLIDANHCPGSALFLFEKTLGHGPSPKMQRVLHCGDFRASPAHVQHALLRPEGFDPVTGQRRQQRIDVCYLDTTYMNPKYAFPSQEDVISACSNLCVQLDQDQDGGVGSATSQKAKNAGIGNAMSKFISAVAGSNGTQTTSQPRGRLLVVMGTYSIGKERICLGIARALKSKIYATAAKKRICACLEDAELLSLLTDDPLEAQIHMQTVFEIRAETLADYLDSMKPHFSRVVGFRPTGWSYRPPAGRMLDNPPVSTVLHSPHWKTPYGVGNLAPQRGSTRESACYGVPYSEHSSFRELTMFCCALRIGRVIPTVNVGSQKSRERMKAWIERWEMEKRKNGLYREEWY